MKPVNTPKTTDLTGYETQLRQPTVTHRQIHQSVKCVWLSNVSVSGNMTPSGAAYLFSPGQAQAVLPEDYDYLLSLKRSAAPGCCGTPVQERRYFEAAS